MNGVLQELLESKPLDSKMSLQLLKLYRKTNDKAIKDKLLLGNMFILKEYLLRRYASLDLVPDDIIAFGYETLMNVILNYQEGELPFRSFVVKGLYLKYKFQERLACKYSLAKLFPNFLYAKMQIEQKYGLSLKNNFSLLDDIISYMIELGLVELQDFDYVKKKIISNLKYMEETEEETIDVNLDIDRLKSALDKAFNYLSKHEREVIILFYGLGLDGSCYSISEIASLLETTEANVQYLKKRALKKLQNSDVNLISYYTGESKS